SIATAGPMAWARTIFRPLIWVLNGTARGIVRLLGVQAVNEHAHIHSPEEIMMLVEESSAGGVLDQEERRLLVNTLQLRHMTARRVMIPRNRMLAAAVDEPLTEMLSMLADSPYSRLPLYEESIDQIVGVVHIKDLLLLLHRPEVIANETGLVMTPNGAPDVAPVPPSLRSIMHPAQFVPDSTLIEDVMTQMQREHQNLAIVIDEYGGTAGMIAFEDLVEEIIGEFQDEFDAAAPGLKLTNDSRIMASGDVDVDDLNELLGIYLPTDAVNTIGGLVVSVLGKIPQAGEEVEIADIPIRIEKMDQNRVVEISMAVTPDQIKRLQRAEA
ncbi:MAG: hemolysin family protein, partial [Chloroflexi bacterium]|nr:hemolysin family protein [Chloroflexota bacterium]